MKMQEKKDRVLAFLRGETVEGVERKLEVSDWYSPTYIGDAVIPHSDLTSGSSVASPVCKALVDEGVMEMNHRGQYRLAKKEV